MKRWLGTMGLMLMVGCGVVTSADPDVDAGAVAGAAGQGTSDPGPGWGTPTNPTPSLGWSTRGDTPSGRLSSWSVLDTVGDRLLVFDAKSSEVWALALSGENELRWSEVTVEGDLPPVLPSSGVYDPVTRSVFTIVHDAPYGSETANELWALSLDEAATWRRLNPVPNLPLGEVDRHALALDVAGRRLFVTGNGKRGCGTWSLELEGEEAWVRLGDATPETCEADLGVSELLVYDTPRDRLVALGTTRALELSPGGQAGWSLLERQPCSGPFVASVHDPERERVLLTGSGCNGTAELSLVTDEWARHAQDEMPYTTCGSLDAARDRIVLCSSFDEHGAIAGQNTTWQLPLDSLELEPLTPDTSGTPLREGANLVWDPEREKVVSWGGQGFQTLTHTLSRYAAWTLTDFGRGPQNHFGVGVFDPVSKMLLGFGGSEGGEQLWRLLPGDAAWQPLDVTGPTPRTQALVVYDDVEHRMLLRGGRPNGQHDEWFDDLWSLSTWDDTPTWTELETEGEGPGPRENEIGVFDPIGRRLLVYGGYQNAEARGDWYALSLDDLTWNPLTAAGAMPALFGPQAVYDAVGQRMIFIGAKNESYQVHALELGEEPAWHTFCQPGLRLVDHLAAQVTLVSDGLFLAQGTSAYRFDLSTPYCD